MSEKQLLHLQVSEAMKAEIRLGTYSGDLPSMEILAESFGVSRVTMRHALHHLEAEGIVNIRQGTRSRLASAGPRLPEIQEIPINRLPNTLGAALSRYIDFMGNPRNPLEAKERVTNIIDAAIELAKIKEGQ